MAKLSFPNLDFINIFVQVRILKMCATSSSSAGLTCQLSRRFGSGEESSLFAKLPPWQIFHPGFELTKENLTTTVCLAAPHPCRIVLLRLFLLFGSLRWELRLLKRQLKEYLSYTVGQFFGIASVPIVVIRNQKWVKSKAVIVGRFFIHHVYPLDGRLIEKFLSSSFLDDNHASVDW